MPPRKPLATLAALCALLGASACLPGFEWIEDGSGVTSTGAGGAGGSTNSAGGAGGSGGEAGHAACPAFGPATDGPYGADALYFGEPVKDETLFPQSTLHHGAVSADGIFFARQWDNGSIVEYTRPDPLAATWGAFSEPSYVFHDLSPHLIADDLRLISCHGGEKKCAMHTRDNLVSPLVVSWYFQDYPPFDGAAADFFFAPSGSGAYLAFASNRASAASDAPYTPDTDLWVAKAVDPLDPTQGYVDLERLDAASAPLADDEPTWISDDGSTVVFHSNRGTTRDVYVTSRPSPAEPFGGAVKIATIATGADDELHFSMPSIATLKAAQPCAHGFAYVRRDHAGEGWFHRVPVCVGAPCP